MDFKVKKIVLDDKRNNREAAIYLEDEYGIEEIVHIIPCYESWEQYNSTYEAAQFTVDYADALNDWLHGGEEPYFEENVEYGSLA